MGEIKVIGEIQTENSQSLPDVSRSISVITPQKKLMKMLIYERKISGSNVILNVISFSLILEFCFV